MPTARPALEIHAIALADLIQQIYDLAYFEKTQRWFTSKDPKVNASWSLDLRVPLSRSEFLRPVALHILDMLAAGGVHQVAGRGFGAYDLVGALVALGDGISGALVRDRPKTYGFGELIEGSLQADQPVAIVDDLLNSGRSAVRTATSLRENGFQVSRVYVLFRFGWRLNSSVLSDAGLACSPMAILRQL